jgi:hypothetical protein
MSSRPRAVQASQLASPRTANRSGRRSITLTTGKQRSLAQPEPDAPAARAGTSG